ncbi:MAG: putative porin [Bacteroidales bacterium]|nr:putative porin [Bacteroidales bacterium]
MFKKLTIIASLLALALSAPAQSTSVSDRGGERGGDDSKEQGPRGFRHAHKKAPVVAPSEAWTILPPLGLREKSTIDTLFENYNRQAIPSLVSDAYCTTGNLGGEGTNMIWLEREPRSDFFFQDGLRPWFQHLQTQRFYNTRIPMTLLSYNTGGGKESSQDRLRAIFSGNINARAQVGANFDYLYSKGSYQYQNTNHMNWGFNGSYLGDRFEFQGFYNHWNMLNKENGGITDDNYILDPEKVQAGMTGVDPKAIPTNLTGAHSRVVGGQLYLNSRYKVGYWHEEQVNDTTVRRTYIPVSSFIWTLNYNQGRHNFVDKSVGELTKFFKNTYLNPNETYDRTKYWSLQNTLGLSMLEGFHRLAKFGLAAYVTHEIRRYYQCADTIDRTELTLSPLPDNYASIEPRLTQNLLYVGGQLTKQRGSILNYEATARFGLVGPAAGDVLLDGNVSTRFPLLGDSLMLRAYGRFENEHPSPLLNQYRSNHFVWYNDFGKERTYRVGGVLSLQKLGTWLNVGVENVQNRIYFGEDFLPVQHGGSVQVFSARLKQHLEWRALNWDNSLTYQTSSDDKVISIPKFAWYSNLYLLTHIATLQIQIGVDCDYYTKYYSPLYQPATMTFANQRNVKVGNYPFMNVYANMKLSKVRFYVQMAHINQGWFSKEYFAMPGYPLNPRRFLLGLSVDFAN